MNKSRGLMDFWVTKTHNLLAGRCPHVCDFCFVSQMRQPAVVKKYGGKLRWHEPAAKDKLGDHEVVFVSDCNDLFAGAVASRLIWRIVDFYCEAVPTNWIHFRTKNPIRYVTTGVSMPDKTILGLSLETTEPTDFYTGCGISHAPNPIDRVQAFTRAVSPLKMVALEPLFDFDLDTMVEWIRLIDPAFVTIGVDSKNTRTPLSPPSCDKLWALAEGLLGICDVILKPNLSKAYDSDRLLLLENYVYHNNSTAFIDNVVYKAHNESISSMNGYGYLEALNANKP